MWGSELIPRLVAIYRRIDVVYTEAAKSAGFSCEGCDGAKCCTVDLTIRTFVEMSYLKQGFKSLPDTQQRDILDRSSLIIKAKEAAPDSEYRNSVCALNSEGMCVLYEYRPMICRFHGMPHFFVGPSGSLVEGEGCLRFKELYQGRDRNQRVDRTQFYREMAALELESVRIRGARTEKRTVAETLVMV